MGVRAESGDSGSVNFLVSLKLSAKLLLRPSRRGGGIEEEARDRVTGLPPFAAAVVADEGRDNLGIADFCGFDGVTLGDS